MLTHHLHLPPKNNNHNHTIRLGAVLPALRLAIDYAAPAAHPTPSAATAPLTLPLPLTPVSTPSHDHYHDQHHHHHPVALLSWSQLPRHEDVPADRIYVVGADAAALPTRAPPHEGLYRFPSLAGVGGGAEGVDGGRVLQDEKVGEWRGREGGEGGGG